MVDKPQSFIVTTDFKTPKVTSTGNNRQPTKIDFKYFKKGQIIKGVLHKDASGNPDVLMVEGTLAVPLEVVKRVIAKDISSADGTAVSSQIELPKISVKPKDKKTKYLDAVVIGAIAGFILTIVSEKNQWVSINEEKPHQNKLIGAGVGGVIGAFLVYRFGNKKESDIK